ncbi:MAG: monooxygenase [Acidimicrobiia bacterium]|nr:monooxygenase [Acidimicrobiia bacterium]
MILTIVRFPGTSTATTDQAAEIFAESAARYLNVPGLLGKAYMRSEDGSVGAVYWWTSRADAQAQFNMGWVEGVTEKYGAAPIVEYYETPIIVDNVTGTIRSEPPRIIDGQGPL